MTVTSTQNKQEYTGDGVTTVFNFTIQSFNPNWMTASEDGLPITGAFVLNDDQDNDAGGTFTADTAPADQSVVTILRTVPLTQWVDLPDYTPFPARNVEDALDKAMMALSQMIDSLNPQPVEGLVEFLNGFILANKALILFKNENDTIDPSEEGVFRLFNDGSNGLALQKSDGISGWLNILTIPQNGAPLFELGAQSSVAPVDASDLTRKDYSDQGDANLQLQIDGLELNKADITYVDAEVGARIARVGDTMTGDLQLYSDSIPDTPFSAASRQYVDDKVDSIVGGLTFVGTWDASGGLLPTPSLPTGEYWIISVAGVLDVSVDGAVPAPTSVFEGDRIVYDGAKAWFAYIPASASLPAVGVTFDPTGLNYTAINVQAALEEADTSMFVHAAGNINEIITGLKTLTEGVIIANNMNIHFPSSDGGIETLGSFRLKNNSNETLQLQWYDGVEWVTSLSIFTSTGRVVFPAVPPSSSLSPTLADQLTRKDYVDNRTIAFYQSGSTGELIGAPAAWVGTHNGDAGQYQVRWPAGTNYTVTCTPQANDSGQISSYITVNNNAGCDVRVSKGGSAYEPNGIHYMLTKNS